MKLRKAKKGQPKGWKDEGGFDSSTGVPVMDRRVADLPGPAVATAERPDPDEAAAVAAPDPELEARIEAAETMYRAAHARVAAAEQRERVAAERERGAAVGLAEALAAERAAEARLAEALEAEHAAGARLADAEARERAAIERLAAADGFERALAMRLEATDSRERAAAERDTIATQRDRNAVERDALANERDRAVAERVARIDTGLRALPADAADDASDHRLEVARLEAELQRAHLDSLTGALRREMGRLVLRNEIERARRGDGRFVVAFIDVDGLKAVNDRDGHAAGDRVLRMLSATLRAHLRSYDPVVRYGGDEFVCGISGVEPDEVNLRLSIIDQALRRSTGVGISAGVARLDASESLEDLTTRADAALLEAKRNRTDT